MSDKRIIMNADGTVEIVGYALDEALQLGAMFVFDPDRSAVGREQELLETAKTALTEVRLLSDHVNKEFGRASDWLNSLNRRVGSVDESAHADFLVLEAKVDRLRDMVEELAEQVGVGDGDFERWVERKRRAALEKLIQEQVDASLCETDCCPHCCGCSRDGGGALAKHGKCWCGMADIAAQRVDFAKALLT